MSKTEHRAPQPVMASVLRWGGSDLPVIRITTERSTVFIGPDDIPAVRAALFKARDMHNEWRAENGQEVAI